MAGPLPEPVSPALAVPAIGVALLAGAWVLSVFDRLAGRAMAGGRGTSGGTGGLLLAPVRRAAFLLLQSRNRTERPDGPAWTLAPALYLALAAVGLAVVPWSASAAPADVPAGIVLWGSVEALAVVAIFLHGWSANAPLALLGGYRYVALGLSAMLVSMFVLIGVALPAESLRMSAVVASQAELWNVVRQPLGLPLFLFVGLFVGFWGPLDFADSADLAGGTAAEVSGASRLVWELARRSMMVAFAAVAATAYLGGWLPAFGLDAVPGPAWLAAKTVLVLALLALLGRWSARVPTERVVTWIWVGLLPASFLVLLLAGLEALR